MDNRNTRRQRFSRRDFLRTLLTGGVAFTGIAASETVFGTKRNFNNRQPAPKEHGESHSNFGTVGEVDYQANGFDPHEMLYDWDYGEISTLPTGQTLREYQIVAVDKEIEIAPGVYFPGWMYNGRIPGPSLRCTEGDRIRIEFVNASAHPHTIHFHGIHAASMDGVPGVGAGEIGTGESTVYEFDAAPFGCHLYHCHATPLKRHIHKGLYGAFIVDPDPKKYQGQKREVAKTRNHAYQENEQYNEMLMVMNGFDTNFDGGNEVYAVNSIAFGYMKKPIQIRANQKQRIYLINITEFDPINSIHIHANFFDYYDHGTTLEPTLKIVDTIMQCQAQRGIVEFSFEGFEPGKYMFHAHQSEFAELGWMGFFEVVDG
ncbi:MAG: multicopper oxidase domain-containing protein [Anaerolineales bacterium]|nr:multicopper oxidase domain-containing protein [Chloroflexota bacterium]MBL6982533.1 multicopper oxidase domain-containing protein [Anaerolineales bacterium]